jgi:outer membrane receptor protein involved in Fe transport
MTQVGQPCRVRVAAIVAASLPLPALPAAAGAPLEQIVVTARKVVEPLQNVPLAIDVLDRERLITGSVADLYALARLSPGLYFESLWGGFGSAPVLRGQSQPSTAGDNVGVFIDGVYQAERTAIDVAPLDVERVEVVRGPQSTLFGRSTFAGALHFVPRAATRDFEQGVGLGVGTDGYATASGFLSGPMLQGQVLGRMAARGVRPALSRTLQTAMPWATTSASPSRPASNRAPRRHCALGYPAAGPKCARHILRLAPSARHNTTAVRLIGPRVPGAITAAHCRWRTISNSRRAFPTAAAPHPS